MLEKLAAVIREQLNLEDVEITEKSNFKDDLGADSLDLFELVMSLEEEFGGIMVTLYRLFTDVRFITKVKKDFIESEMDKVLADEIKELDSYFV